MTAEGSSGGSSTLDAWQELKASLTRDQFVEKFHHPFLIRRSNRGAEAGGRVAFETMIVGAEDISSVARLGSLRDSLVFPVVKAEGNPFRDQVSVGRASNCDVVIRSSTVSKLHAYFKVLGPGEAQVVDAKSANGTFLNGMLLKANEPVRTQSGDTIVFGGISVQFLHPGRFYDVL